MTKPPPLPIEVTLIKAVADFEAKHGALTEREKLLYQSAFISGHSHGLDTGTAIFNEAMAGAFGSKP